jgi:glutamate-ammonia-ligase adenylyltransferase
VSALADLLQAAPFVFDGAAAEARLADLAHGAEKARASALAAMLRQPSGRPFALLRGVAAGSPYLLGLCLADTRRLARLLGTHPQAALRRTLGKARRACARSRTKAEAMRALRLLKQEAALLIGLADLGGVWDVPAVTHALTLTADTAVSSALSFLLREAAEAQRIRLADPDDPEAGCGLVTLAMGKHGAFELNYSSDIDLIVFYDPDSAPLTGDLEPSAFFVRLTQGLVKMLSERTSDGYVFRVDLRLRPDPAATAVAISLPAAFSYYESVGQNWERAALIKARACAGDRAAGERFLAGIAPFIWRRHLDFAAIADIHAMKRQIHAHRGHGTIAVAGHDLKLGRGGIREIEFFVQTQQLIAGGRDPTLRGRQTLATLTALCEAGWIAAHTRDELAEAYCFLRAIEHRLQMVEDEQVHSLPREPEALARFARFAGFAEERAFAEALVARLGTIQTHYAKLFEASPELATDAGSLVFTGKADDPETLDTLSLLGFSKPAQVAETIRGWHFGRYPAMRSARAREDLTELTPALLEALSRAGRPDQAFAAFDGLLSRTPSGYQLLSILRNNPRLLDIVALILGVAPRLAELVATRPHALDGLLEPTGPGMRDEAALEARLRRALTIGEGYEERLDRARIFAREQLFVIGARLLAGDIDPPEAGEEISALAAAAIRVLLDLVQGELAGVHGTAPGGRLAILAMGKLGGREMTATSDLDLIVLYDHAEEATQTDGGRPIAPSTWYARLTQRLIAALSAPTAQGTLFQVDMRLRPSGRKGPVAIHRDGFVDYQKNEAWTWEHMALTRARVVAGDEGFGRDIERAIGDILAMPRNLAKTRRDIVEMRRLLAQEKPGGRWNLKHAPGGMVDVEFIAQAGQLLGGRGRPGLFAPNTGEALERLAAAGLLDRRDCEEVRAAWRLYGDLLHLIRLCTDSGFDPATAPDPLKALLADSVGEPDFGVLQARVEEYEHAVTRIFRKVIDGTEKEH